MPENLWEKRERLKKQAEKHNKLMEEKYSDEINRIISTSVVYDDLGKNGIKSVTIPKDGNNNIKFSLVDSDILSAAINLKKDNVGILNFASYKYPGGGYINGTAFSEEILCHNSVLYQVLKEFDNTYYNINQAHLNKELFENRALFLQDVLFIKNGKEYKFNILNCSAPNFGLASKNYKINERENLSVLAERIEFIIKIFAEQECRDIVLGNWGCEIFKQKPANVANLFIQFAKKYSSYFDNVIFAVPKSTLNNDYDEFKKMVK